MIKMINSHKLILTILIEKGVLASSQIHSELILKGSEVSLITVKRELAEMKSLGLVTATGAGRSVVYQPTTLGRLYLPVDPNLYSAVEPDKRYGQTAFNFELFPALSQELFSEAELGEMDNATKEYQARVKDVPTAIREKELERFIIELAWKSSRIEGNTYTLLDTERLIREGIAAPGHDEKEATMILNHKESFKFIREHHAEYQEISLVKIEEVHKILIKGLGVNYGLRTKPVGITGSRYRPLDNQYQINEAVQALISSVQIIGSSYSKALLIILGLSYIQPFEDGNKRTARLMANAILISRNLAPLSYRSVDEDTYKEALMVFYEVNSIMPFKKIFFEQYLFAAKNYLIG